MPTVKTAISIQETLFKEAEALAQQLEVPRSRLFVMALEDFIKQHHNQQLLAQLNETYEHEPDQPEREHVKRMKPRHRRIVEGEW